MDKIAEIEKKKEDYYDENGGEFENLSEFERLAEYLDEQLDLNKGNQEICTKIKEIYSGIGLRAFYCRKYDIVIKSCSKVIDLDNENREAYLKRAEAYFYKKDYEKAIEDYEKCINLDKNKVYSYYNYLAIAYAFNKEYEKSRALLMKVLNLSKEDKEKKQIIEKDIYNNLGLIYYLNKDNKNAKKYYEEALKIDNNHKEAHNNLGLIYYKEKNYEEARKCYKKVIELDDNYIESYNNLGLIYYELKNYDEAIESYKKAIGIDRSRVCSNMGFRRFIEENLVINKEEILNLIFDNRLYLSVNILNILNKVDISDLGDKEEKGLVEKIEKIRLNKEDFGDDDFNMETPNTLYLYRNINEYTIKSLVYKGVYKSNSEQFNDPFDPYFKRYKNDRFSFLYKKLCETKISCLTQTPENMLMWSHYGDNHKGICLEYEIDKEKLEKNKEVSLKEIKYEGLKVNSEITLSDSEMIFINGEGKKEQSKRKIIENINTPEIFIRKNGEWKYEKEYRLIYFDKNDKEEYFKDIKLKSVTFGLHTTESDKDFIRELLKDKYKDENIEYYQIEEKENLQLKRKKIE